MQFSLPTRARTLGLSAACLALTSATLSADTLKVPKDFETIQEAVVAATGADVVAISAGTYTENIYVPAGKNGLQIIGKGRVIIDAHDPPRSSEGQVIPTTSMGFELASSGITIKNVTIRHANNIGIGTGNPQAEGQFMTDDIVLDKVTFINIDSIAVQLTGDDITITKCQVWDTQGPGMQVLGDNAIIDKNQLLKTGAFALRVDGNNAQVTKNTIQQVRTDVAIYLFGDSAVLDGNRILSADGPGMWINGADAVVNKNSIEQTGGLFGLEGAGGGGISTIGTNPTITGNKVSRVLFFADAIRVDNQSQGGEGLPRGLIEGNTVEDGHGIGIHVFGDGMTISKNKVQGQGIDAAGIFVRGSGNEISTNQVKESSNDGITIDGDDNLVSKNKVLNCTEDGIVLVGGPANQDNVLDGNTISGNQSEGVENGASNTTLRKNKIKNNRLDVVNDGDNGATLVIEDNNKIGDDSNGSDQPEI